MGISRIHSNQKNKKKERKEYYFHILTQKNILSQNFIPTLLSQKSILTIWFYLPKDHIQEWDQKIFLFSKKENTKRRESFQFSKDDVR